MIIQFNINTKLFKNFYKYLLILNLTKKPFSNKIVKY